MWFEAINKSRLEYIIAFKVQYNFIVGSFLNMLLVHTMWINSVVNIAENFKRRLDKFAIEFKN